MDLSFDYPTATSSGTSYLTADHLGSPRINTDVNGNVTARHDYMPFGEEISTSQRTSIVGYPGDSVRKQFTGYERDGETGLDFAQARFLASAVGRFTSPDSFQIADQVNKEPDAEEAARQLAKYIKTPANWNAYAYTANNPLKYVDPTGNIIELTGSKEDQQKALERIKRLLGAERFALVEVSLGQCNNDSPTGTTRITLPDKNVEKFSKIGDNENNLAFSSKMGFILNTTDSVEFRVAEKYTDKDGEHSVTEGEFGGAATVSSDNSLNGRFQIFVHPDAASKAYFATTSIAGRSKTSDGKPLDLTNEGVDGHEFGHAYDGLKTGSMYMGSSIQMENSVRERTNNPQKRIKE